MMNIDNIKRKTQSKKSEFIDVKKDFGSVSRSQWFRFSLFLFLVAIIIFLCCKLIYG